MAEVAASIAHDQPGIQYVLVDERGSYGACWVDGRAGSVGSDWGVTRFAVNPLVVAGRTDPRDWRVLYGLLRAFDAPNEVLGAIESAVAAPVLQLPQFPGIVQVLKRSTNEQRALGDFLDVCSNTVVNRSDVRKAIKNIDTQQTLLWRETPQSYETYGVGLCWVSPLSIVATLQGSGHDGEQRSWDLTAWRGGEHPFAELHRRVASEGPSVQRFTEQEPVVLVQLPTGELAISHGAHRVVMLLVMSGILQLEPPKILARVEVGSQQVPQREHVPDLSRARHTAHVGPGAWPMSWRRKWLGAHQISR